MHDGDPDYEDDDFGFDIDYDQIDPPIPSYKIDLLDVAIIGLNVTTGVLRAVHDGFAQLANGLMATHNYRIDQRDFAEQVRAELESIPTTTTED